MAVSAITERQKKRLMMKIKNLIVLLPMALMTGCTKEDVSECAVEIRFEYEYNTARVDKFTSDIHKLTLFVFNEAGDLVRELPMEGNNFPDNYRIRTKLDAGKYSFVAWGEMNNDMPHDRGTSGRLSESFLRLRTGGSATTGYTVETTGVDPVEWDKGASYPHNIYYGASGENNEGSGTITQVEVKHPSNQKVLISMVKDTKSIRVNFNGLPMSSANKDYFYCRITAANSEYDFYNRLVGNKTVTYIPQVYTTPASSGAAHDAKQTNDFVTMRLFGDNSCQSQLTLIYQAPASSPVTILNTPLTELIKSTYTSPAVDFVRDDVFELNFNYDGDYTFTNYTITAGGWTHVSGTGGTGGFL